MNNILHYDNHDLYMRNEIVADNHSFYICECRNCDVEILFKVSNQKYSVVYTSFPHMMFKSFQCGKKLKLSDFKNIFIKKNYNREITEFKAGLYSGYPFCCVLYLTFISNYIPNGSLYKNLIHFTRRNLDLPESGSTHISCPICNFLGRKNIGKFDPKGVNCTKVSLAKSVFSAVEWRLLGKHRKEKRNKIAIFDRGK